MTVLRRRWPGRWAGTPANPYATLPGPVPDASIPLTEQPTKHSHLPALCVTLQLATHHCIVVHVREGGGVNFVRGLFCRGNFRRGKFSPALQISKLTVPQCALPKPPEFARGNFRHLPETRNFPTKLCPPEIFPSPPPSPPCTSVAVDTCGPD